MKCTYPDCNCPFDMGEEEKCLIGYEASGMKVTEENTATIVRNLRSEEGDYSSRAKYVELMQQRIAELEAERDRLMLEFCPDEMKEEQIKRWGESQKASPRELEMQTIMWAEQKPDLYDGPGCNEIRHRFECFCEGDMQSDFLDSIELNASEFPPGTKIIIQAPSCPKCGEHCEMCQEDDLCDFDWESWVADKYQ